MTRITLKLVWISLPCFWFLLPAISWGDADSSESFYFGQAAAPQGAIPVARSEEYTADKGYGWMPEQPNVFGADLPEGNYVVTVRYKNPGAAAASTVKAESRRLMLMKQENPDGEVRRFAVNIRRPEIEGGASVRLNDRERYPQSGRWDERLTLEFLPDPNGVEQVRVEPASEVVTLYIAGDSTVTDQPREPYSGWGQMLPRFFDPGVAVANHAESGRALYSFRYERRLDKILSHIRPGDYLFIQFGHNDQKNKKTGAGPFTTYSRDLEDYITEVRKKEAVPVLVTPMERLRWSGEILGETLTEYAEAVRQVGDQQRVPVIDLHAMSLQFYRALGPEESTSAFVFYPANTYPGQSETLKDRTHHNTYGAYELARCVVQGIKRKVPDLARHLRSDVGEFEPSRPESPGDLGIPASLAARVAKPEGS